MSEKKWDPFYRCPNCHWDPTGCRCATMHARNKERKEVTRTLAHAEEELRCVIANDARALKALRESEKTVKKLRELVREVALSGVEFDDKRVGYVVVQIGRETWDEVQAEKGKR